MNSENAHFFSLTEGRLLYQPFYSETGPPSLEQIHYVCSYVQTHLQQYPQIPLFLYCPPYYPHFNNILIYLGAIQTVFHLSISENNSSSDQIFDLTSITQSYTKPIRVSSSNFILSRIPGYRDASSSPSTFKIEYFDCIQGFLKAYNFGWYQLNSFNLDKWKEHETPEGGNLNWIIPDQLLAFASPRDLSVKQFGKSPSSPELLASLFHQFRIKNIIRLSSLVYDETPFLDADIKIIPISYGPDQVPSLKAREKFLKILSKGEPTAVHCSNGLGKTGTLIACYLIKNFGFIGKEAIAWIRMCRPGSIIEGQQVYLLRYAAELQAEKQNVDLNKEKKGSPQIMSPLSRTSPFLTQPLKDFPSAFVGKAKLSQKLINAEEKPKSKVMRGLTCTISKSLDSPTKRGKQQKKTLEYLTRQSQNSQTPLGPEYPMHFTEDQLVEIFF